MSVRWNSSLSGSFKVTNGVRQGGILSPHLFAIYMHDLSIHLNSVNTGCSAGGIVTKHWMYADDLVFFSSCAVGIDELLKICELYAIEHALLEVCCNYIYKQRF